MPPKGSIDLPFNIEGRPPVAGRYAGDVKWRTATPRYFDVFRVPLLRGRSFTDLDDDKASGVVVINEAMAKKFWPHEDPVGERITIGKGLGPELEEPAREIIGIVADMKEAGLNQDVVPAMCVPIAQVNDGVNALLNRVIPMQWVIRTTVEPYSMSETIQNELRIASGGLPVAHVRSMRQVVNDSEARTKFNTVLLSIFAIVALLLAAIGIYGLMAYSVQQRAQEIAIRLTLGATPARVRNMIVLEALATVLAGIVTGIASGIALTRLMRSLVYGVKTSDPAVFATMVLVLSVTALIAAYLPARRAARIDPIVSLRYE
jgi:putative ABC transport system permease protein